MSWRRSVQSRPRTAGPTCALCQHLSCVDCRSRLLTQTDKRKRKQLNDCKHASNHQSAVTRSHCQPRWKSLPCATPYPERDPDPGASASEGTQQPKSTGEKETEGKEDKEGKDVGGDPAPVPRQAHPLIRGERKPGKFRQVAFVSYGRLAEHVPNVDLIHHDVWGREERVANPKDLDLWGSRQGVGLQIYRFRLSPRVASFQQPDNQSTLAVPGRALGRGGLVAR